jgi:proline iminopeptidase
MPALDYLWGHAFKEIDVTKGLAQLKVPVFLALGRFDYSVAPYSSWARVRPHFHDLTVRVFEQSSHTPQLEESELFDRELIGWLTSKS